MVVPSCRRGAPAFVMFLVIVAFSVVSELRSILVHTVLPELKRKHSVVGAQLVWSVTVCRSVLLSFLLVNIRCVVLRTRVCPRLSFTVCWARCLVIPLLSASDRNLNIA